MTDEQKRCAFFYWSDNFCLLSCSSEKEMTITERRSKVISSVIFMSKVRERMVSFYIATKDVKFYPLIEKST